MGINEDFQDALVDWVKNDLFKHQTVVNNDLLSSSSSPTQTVAVTIDGSKITINTQLISITPLYRMTVTQVGDGTIRVESFADATTSNPISQERMQLDDPLSLEFLKKHLKIARKFLSSLVPRSVRLASENNKLREQLESK